MSDLEKIANNYKEILNILLDKLKENPLTALKDINNTILLRDMINEIEPDFELIVGELKLSKEQKIGHFMNNAKKMLEAIDSYFLKHESNKYFLDTLNVPKTIIQKDFLKGDTKTMISLAEFLLIIAAISSNKDTFLDRAIELPEEQQNDFLSLVDKYIDFNKEEKELIQKEKKQQELIKNEKEKGSFFGLMLEGRGNAFLDPTPKVTRQLEELKEEKERLCEVLELEQQKFQELKNYIESQEEKYKEIDLELDEQKRENEILRGQLHQAYADKEQMVDMEIKFTALQESLTLKDGQIEKIKADSNQLTKEHLETIAEKMQEIRQRDDKIKELELLLKDKAQLSARVKELQAYKDQTSDFDLVKSELIACKRDIVSLEKQLDEKTRDLASYFSDLMRERNTVQEKDYKIESLNTQLDGYKTQIENLEKIIKEKEEDEVRGEFAWLKKKENALAGNMDDSPVKKPEPDPEDPHNDSASIKTPGSNSDEDNISNQSFGSPEKERAKQAEKEQPKTLKEYKKDYKRQEKLIKDLQEDNNELIKELNNKRAELARLKAGSGNESARIHQSGLSARRHHSVVNEELDKDGKMTNMTPENLKAVEEKVRENLKNEVQSDFEKKVEVRVIEEKANLEALFKKKQEEYQTSIKDLQEQLKKEKELLKEKEEEIKSNYEKESKKQLEDQSLEIEKQAKTSGEQKIQEAIKAREKTILQEIEKENEVKIEKIVQEKEKKLLEEFTKSTEEKIESIRKENEVLLQQKEKEIKEEFIKNSEKLLQDKEKEITFELAKVHEQKMKEKEAEILDKVTKANQLKLKEMEVELAHSNELKLQEQEKELTVDLIKANEAKIEELKRENNIRFQEKEKEVEENSKNFLQKCEQELKAKKEEVERKLNETIAKKEKELRTMLEESIRHAEMEKLSSKEKDIVKEIESKTSKAYEEKMKIELKNKEDEYKQEMKIEMRNKEDQIRRDLSRSYEDKMKLELKSKEEDFRHEMKVEMRNKEDQIRQELTKSFDEKLKNEVKNKEEQYRQEMKTEVRNQEERIRQDLEREMERKIRRKVEENVDDFIAKEKENNKEKIRAMERDLESRITQEQKSQFELKLMKAETDLKYQLEKSIGERFEKEIKPKIEKDLENKIIGEQKGQLELKLIKAESELKSSIEKSIENRYEKEVKPRLEREIEAKILAEQKEIFEVKYKKAEDDLKLDIERKVENRYEREVRPKLEKEVEQRLNVVIESKLKDKLEEEFSQKVTKEVEKKKLVKIRNFEVTRESYFAISLNEWELSQNSFILEKSREKFVKKNLKVFEISLSLNIHSDLEMSKEVSFKKFIEKRLERRNVNGHDIFVYNPNSLYVVNLYHQDQSIGSVKDPARIELEKEVQKLKDHLKEKSAFENLFIQTTEYFNVLNLSKGVFNKIGFEVNVHKAKDEAFKSISMDFVGKMYEKSLGLVDSIYSKIYTDTEGFPELSKFKGTEDFESLAKLFVDKTWHRVCNDLEKFNLTHVFNESFHIERSKQNKFSGLTFCKTYMDIAVDNYDKKLLYVTYGDSIFYKPSKIRVLKKKKIPDNKIWNDSSFTLFSVVNRTKYKRVFVFEEFVHENEISLIIPADKFIKRESPTQTRLDKLAQKNTLLRPSAAGIIDPDENELIRNVCSSQEGGVSGFNNNSTSNNTQSRNFITIESAPSGTKLNSKTPSQPNVILENNDLIVSNRKEQMSKRGMSLNSLPNYVLEGDKTSNNQLTHQNQNTSLVHPFSSISPKNHENVDQFYDYDNHYDHYYGYYPPPYYYPYPPVYQPYYPFDHHHGQDDEVKKEQGHSRIDSLGLENENELLKSQIEALTSQLNNSREKEKKDTIANKIKKMKLDESLPHFGSIEGKKETKKDNLNLEDLKVSNLTSRTISTLKKEQNEIKKRFEKKDLGIEHERFSPNIDDINIIDDFESKEKRYVTKTSRSKFNYKEELNKLRENILLQNSENKVLIERMKKIEGENSILNTSVKCNEDTLKALTYNYKCDALLNNSRLNQSTLNKSPEKNANQSLLDLNKSIKNLGLEQFTEKSEGLLYSPLSKSKSKEKNKNMEIDGDLLVLKKLKPKYVYKEENQTELRSLESKLFDLKAKKRAVEKEMNNLNLESKSLKSMEKKDYLDKTLANINFSIKSLRVIMNVYKQ